MSTHAPMSMATERGRGGRAGAWIIAVLQFLLAVLCSVQLWWYVDRGTPEQDSVATSPFNAGGWTDLLALLGGLAWYMIAFALPLAILLGLAGGALLTWRQRRLSRALIWALAVGTSLCTGIVLLGMTPFGQAMRTWWLD